MDFRAWVWSLSLTVILCTIAYAVLIVLVIEFRGGGRR